MKIYLVCNEEKAGIIVCNEPKDVSLKLWDGDYELYEIGLADPDTPPGCLLAGTSAELTNLRPIGKKIR